MSARRLERIRGLLIDVDGTLLVDEVATPGAREVLQRLAHSGMPFRLITNATRRSRSATAAALWRAGIGVEPEKILLPAIVARLQILESGRLRAALLVPPDAIVDFDGVSPDDEGPDWVVVGDLGPGFSWNRMNLAFRALRGGAAFLALHKSPFWSSGAEGLVLDAGSYVAALEYATGRSAELVGKPAPAFFRMALSELGIAPADVLVVGDSLETDVRGGAAAGCQTALVGHPPLTAQEGVRPHFALGSIGDLVPLLP